MSNQTRDESWKFTLHTYTSLLQTITTTTIPTTSTSTKPFPSTIHSSYSPPQQFLGAWYEVERYFVSYEEVAGTCWVENYLHAPGRGYYTKLDWKGRLWERLSIKLLSSFVVLKCSPAS